MLLNLIVIRTNQLEALMEFYQCFELAFNYHRHGKGVMHYSCEMDNGIVFEIYPLLLYPCKVIDEGGMIRIPGTQGKEFTGKIESKLYFNGQHT